jgi:MFS family permease
VSEPGRHRLNWLLSSSALSNLGDGIGRVAFPLLATTLTRDPVLIAGLAAVQQVPWLLFSAISGVLLDRTDRRRAMMLANLTRAVVIGLLAVLVLLDGAGIAAVYLAALLVGTAEVVADSAANVLIPAVVVDRNRLESANSKLQTIETVCQTFLGNPIGSVAFATFAALPFLLGSGSFAIAGALMVVLAGSLAPHPPPPRNGSRLRAELAMGVRWLRGNALMARLVIIVALLGLTIEFAQAQLVLYALQDLHLSEAAFGVFALAAGVGGVLGAALTPALTKVLPRRGVLIGGILLIGCALAAMGFVRTPLAAGVLLGAFGVGVVGSNVIIATVRHLAVPDELLGRVIGVWRTLVWGAMPIGALIGGLITKALGSPSRTFVVSGVCVIVIGLAAVVLLRRFPLDLDTRQESRPASA